MFPKSVCRLEDKDENGKQNGLVISNVTSSSEYRVKKVNYFINAPVELHIIEVLWCLIVGPVLEEDLSEHCYGNRLEDEAKKYVQPENATNIRSLFKFYVNQYGAWRNRALDIATDIHNNNENVALLSLDLKSYFYNVNLDFGKITAKIEKAFEDKEQIRQLALKLNESLETIFSAYLRKITPHLKLTHSESKDKIGLPIGFVSSYVLGNWYLAEFDKDILEIVRPDYYGRYVDDIILVFKNPGTEYGDNQTVTSIVSKFLSDILIEDENGAQNPCFHIKVDGNQLPIQQDKMIYYRLEKEHSRAVLEVFKEELQERTSAFRFLPGEDIEMDLDRFAYDILYEGSRNKLRSITGLRENATELAIYLAKHVTLHRLCRTNRKDSVLLQLERFFKGKNVFQFMRLWEKVYQYAVIVRGYEFIQSFFVYLNSEINKAEIHANNEKNENLSRKMADDLKRYNKISLGLSVALLNTDLFRPNEEESAGGSRENSILLPLVRDEGIGPLAMVFRNANLIRHYLVAWPLANYTRFRGNLTDELKYLKSSRAEDLVLLDEKIERSPRFIHFDECQLFFLQKSLAENEPQPLLPWQKKSWRQYEEYFSAIPGERTGGSNGLRGMQTLKRFQQAFSEMENSKEEKESSGTIQKYSFIEGKEPKKPRHRIRIALANIKIRMSDVENAIRMDRMPNLSSERQDNLYGILNSAVKERADVLVMPELSTPVSWLPFMASHCRRHQQAMIFGLEHWDVRGRVYNLLVELLPFKLSRKYNSCYMTARIKNHYAPDELRLISDLRLKLPHSVNDHKSYYHKIIWRGINFASYNCFELSDIEHRALFKSEIDILFACVCNKDTNYFQSILESASRDIHCYVVQSNASQYGGSCVLKPAKTEEKTMLSIKGGENSCVLISEIDVAALRDFQYKPSSFGKNSFKPLPPGFDSEKVLER